MLFCLAGGNVAGEASQVSVAALGPGRAVTAVRGGGGKLVVIVWNIDESGRVERVGTPADTAEHATLGRVTRVAIVSLGQARVLTVMRDDEGKLRLVVWNVAENGSISRVGAPTPGFGTAIAGAVTEIAVARLTDSRVVTAMRDDDNNLRLIVWDVNEAGSLIRLGTATAKATSRVTAVALGTSRVVTAIINGDGKLQLISWNVSDAGGISRDVSKTIGAAQEVAATAVGELAAVNVVTAIRNGQGKLQVNGWTVPTDGPISEVRLTVSGEVSKVALALLASGSVAVVMRTAEKMLRLHGYGFGATVFQEEPFATSDLKSEVEIAPTLGIASLRPLRVFTAAARGDILNVDVWDLAVACS